MMAQQVTPQQTPAVIQQQPIGSYMKVGGPSSAPSASMINSQAGYGVPQPAIYAGVPA